jgi:hypothetical protein
MRKFFLAAIVVWLSSICAAQHLVPASPPLADLRDDRFVGTKEDWSSPALTSSTLRPVAPLLSNIGDYGSYTLQIVRLQWRFGDPIDLYISKPKGVKKPPVVLYLYGFPSDTDRFKDDHFQEAVTKDGFAAAGFVSATTGQRYHDRPIRQWFVSELQESLAVSAHDVQMVLNYLASRGDLDIERVGMFAQGSGASIAILASAVEPRIKVLDLVDPWGDWPDWFGSSPLVPETERATYLKPEFLQKIAPLDPITWVPKTQAKRVRLQLAMFGRTTPAAVKEKIRAAANLETGRTTVLVYRTPQETKPISRGNLVLQWIEHELRSLSPAGGEEKLGKKDERQGPSHAEIRDPAD